MKPLPAARRILCALAYLLALGAVAEAKDWSHVKVATEGAYPPFNATAPSGKIVGFEPDLLKTMCDRLKITCELVAQDFDGSIPGLLAGKFDVIMSGMAITAKREQVISFSEPYSDTPTTFATLKTSPLAAMPMGGEDLNLSAAGATAKTEALRQALQGRTVGVQVATIQLDLLNQFFKEGVTIRTYKNNDEIVLDLKSGRIDAMVGAQGNVVAAVTRSKGDIVYAGPLFSGGPLGSGTGLGMRKEDADLKAMFDKEITAAKADGTTKALSIKWFGFDVTPR